MSERGDPVKERMPSKKAINGVFVTDPGAIAQRLARPKARHVQKSHFGPTTHETDRWRARSYSLEDQLVL